MDVTVSLVQQLNVNNWQFGKIFRPVWVDFAKFGTIGWHNFFTVALVIFDGINFFNPD